MSSVSGTLVDFRGEPLSDTRIHLRGQAQSPWSDTFYGSVVEPLRRQLFNLAGWKDTTGNEYPVGHNARTDNAGRFVFSGVVAGFYYVVCGENEGGVEDSIPLPKTYYPGVRDWREATKLVVEEAKPVRNVVFRLPDYGRKRQVHIRIVDEDGSPVAGAVVQASVLPGNGAPSKIGVRRTTDANGHVIYEVWPTSAYHLSATLSLAERRYHSEVIEISAGTEPVKTDLILSGYRTRTR